MATFFRLRSIFAVTALKGVASGVAVKLFHIGVAAPDATPFKAVTANIDLNLKNVAINEWQRRSELFDLTKEDAIPDLEFSIVLWHAIKGDHVPFPGPRRAAFIKVKEGAEDDDD
jgi:hypothetical protein